MLHTRLRTKCSSLNKDLFDKKIVVSPHCQCGRIESTYHYFFECPIYANHSLELFTSLPQHINVTLNLILSGYTLLSDDINTIIFEKVQKYIIDTKRFDNWLNTPTKSTTVISMYLPASPLGLFVCTQSHLNNLLFI